MTATSLAAAHDDRSRRLAGIGLMLLGIFLFSLNDALGKYLVATYSVGQLLLIRSVAALVLLSPFDLARRAPISRAAAAGAAGAARGAFDAEVAAFFGAVTYLPLADVMTFYLAGADLRDGAVGDFARRAGRLAALERGRGRLLRRDDRAQPSAQTFSWPALIALAGSFSFALLMM